MAFYLLGTAAVIYHLANGLSTGGICRAGVLRNRPPHNGDRFGHSPPSEIMLLALACWR